MIRFRPKLLDTLPGYSRGLFVRDLSAGIWTAIVAGFLVSALGDSRVQIGGPNMGEWRTLKWSELKRFSNNYRIILLGTFFITLVFDLTLAVEIGMVLASLFFIYRMSDLARIERIHLERYHGFEHYYELETLTRPDGSARIQAYRLFGSLFFGAANKLEGLLTQEVGRPDVVILDMEKVINIDTTGLDILQTLQRNLDRRGITLVLCDLNAQPRSIILRSGFLDTLGADNVTGSLADALMRAQRLPGRDAGISYV